MSLSHLFRATLARQLPTLLRPALPEQGAEVKLREHICDLLFRVQHKSDAQKPMEHIFGAAPARERAQPHSAEEKVPLYRNMGTSFV